MERAILPATVLRGADNPGRESQENPENPESQEIQERSNATDVRNSAISPGKSRDS